MKKTKKYGATPEEACILEAAKCREIVSEVLNFGVNQHQITTLIKLLSLELENRDLMLKIVNAIEGKNEHQIINENITV